MFIFLAIDRVLRTISYYYTKIQNMEFENGIGSS